MAASVCRHSQCSGLLRFLLEEEFHRRIKVNWLALPDFLLADHRLLGYRRLFVSIREGVADPGIFLFQITEKQPNNECPTQQTTFLKRREALKSRGCAPDAIALLLAGGKPGEPGGADVELVDLGMVRPTSSSSANSSSRE
ncbi:hypothetical protein R1flu_015525 [Riccia fluitans]|uniref:Uncharacterized protein n=1 Tax=Riccia fluitans TaxID=41844 RepID=A0ABD1YK92_9MARC